MTPKFKVGDVVVRRLARREITAIGRDCYLYIENGNEYASSIEHIDAGFTLKPKEITITKEDLARAWDNSLVMVFKAKASADFDALCKELGLE